MIEPNPKSALEKGASTKPAPSSPDGRLRRILVVDESKTTCGQLQKILHSETVHVDTLTDAAKALRTLIEVSHSIAIVKLHMPRLDGLELLREIAQRRLPVSVIVTTEHGSINEAVEAMRLGAYDFLPRPIAIDHLRLVVDRALRERALQDEVGLLREQLRTKYSFQNILSKNPHMHAVFELIANVAHTNTTVLIEGDTGTGKEQVARAVHASSDRSSRPFVAVNCAALPESLLESELFGHEKGAFTSAIGQRHGRFELADGGTIFFDEIGDVPAAMQAKLLRVLQERSFERVGGVESIHVDVRVIAATNRPLHRMVREGKFREDLYYRLNVVRIELPRLRERPEDIPLLATHFIEKYTLPEETRKRITAQAMEVLLRYHWPGNIRELENAIERACVTSHDDSIRVDNLPPELLRPRRSRRAIPIDLTTPLSQLVSEATAQIERQYIQRALEKTHGHVGRCAQICGLSRRCITSKIAEYKLDKTRFKDD